MFSRFCKHIRVNTLKTEEVVPGGWGYTYQKTDY